MPNRSSSTPEGADRSDDPNVRASGVVDHATGEPSPLDRFTAVIEDAQELLKTGEDPSDIAARLWPRVLKILPEPEDPAVALGRKGGRKGGKARAAKLSSERKSEIARKAAEARWGKKEDT